MTKKILAVDIDGCLTGTDYICKRLSHYANKSISNTDLKEYDIKKTTNLSEKEEILFWKNESENLYKLSDYDLIAIKNIINLSKRHDKTIILTKRFLWGEDITKKWLDNLQLVGFKYEHLIMTDNQDKEPFIEKEKVTSLIEDNGELTEHLAKSKPEIITYLIDRAYNRNHISHHRLKSNFSETK